MDQKGKEISIEEWYCRIFCDITSNENRPRHYGFWSFAVSLSSDNLQFLQLFFSIFWHHSSIITSLWKRDDESQLILNSPSSDSEANFIINGNHQPSSSSGTTSLDVGFVFPKAGKLKTPVSQVSHWGFLVDKIMWSFSFSLFVHYIFDKLQESASDLLIVFFLSNSLQIKSPI